MERPIDADWASPYRIWRQRGKYPAFRAITAADANMRFEDIEMKDR
jgi:hypothetical protein